MKTLTLLFLSFILFNCTPLKSNLDDNTQMNKEFNVNKSEDDWKAILTPEQYYVLRKKGTEKPFSGKYLNHNENGTYTCAACGFELFSSDSKFDSHCGWPSFDNEIAKSKIKKQIDTSFGMIRTEILCSNCGSHLGHLFNDGPTESGLRYCVNSLSIEFKEK